MPLEPVAISALSPVDADAYDRWHGGLPDGMIYGERRFASFVARAARGRVEHLIARRSNQIVGALPYAWREAEGVGIVANSLPWYGSHGGCWLSDPADQAVRRALLAALGERLRRLDPLFSSVILSPGEFMHLGDYRDCLSPDAEDDRIGQLSNLPEDGPDLEDRLFGGMEQKTRNLVRKSLKQGFRERADGREEDWRFLFDSHVANMGAIGGKAKSWEHFVGLHEAFPDARVSVALDGDRPVAALLLLSACRTVEYITPTALLEERSRQPLSFLILHGMCWAARAGLRRWNWGGTWRSQSSLHHFKAGWGATDAPYAYLAKASPAGRQALSERREELLAAFPYWYLYPFSAPPR